MAIPRTLLDELLAQRLLPAGSSSKRRAALVVRHAERHPIVELRAHHTLLLTERGHATARASGNALADVVARGGWSRVRAVHSPVERCAETARGLAAGLADVGVDVVVGGADSGLGDPFLRDRDASLALAGQLGPSFLRAWFDGHISDAVLQEHRAACHDQVSTWARHLRQADNDELIILVSHDWNIALVREVVLGVSHETTWPHFLDGVVVVADADDGGVAVSFAGRTARTSGATRPARAS